jgi:hypothetical protein
MSRSAVWGPQSLLLSGYWGSFVQVKRPGREADRSHPSSAEVKNEWSCTSIPRKCCHVLNKFIFTLVNMDLLFVILMYIWIKWFVLTI